MKTLFNYLFLTQALDSREANYICKYFLGFQVFNSGGDLHNANIFLWYLTYLTQHTCQF